MAYPIVDFKGFEKQVSNARKIIQNHGAVFVLYSKTGGFIFRKSLDSDLEFEIEIKNKTLVGAYKKPLRSPDIIDDLESTLLEHS